MSTQRLNAAEKDLEKFIKFLALKSTQIVVQSRLGEKIQTNCNPLASGSDWFNLVIQDHPDVAADTKRALALGPGDSILSRFPLCVEISLKTVEGDQLQLEVWSLDLQLPASHTNGHQAAKEKDDQIDGNGGLATKNEIAKNGSVGCSGANNTEQQTLKAAHAIYNRMGILLKSLISLTRATPAYKLSRRQCADSYGIYYRIYVERPQVSALGEGFKQVKIGQLHTIVGTLSVSVAYRTKMTITPTTSYPRGSDGMLPLKPDHFRPNDSSPTTLQPQLAGKKGSLAAAVADRKAVDIDKPLRPGAFADISKLRQYTEEDFVLPETPPFEWLLRRARCESGSSGESLNRKSESPVVMLAVSPLGNGHQHNINNNSNTGSNCCNINNNNNNHITQQTNGRNNNNMAAFKSLENDENAGKLPAQQFSLSQSSTDSLLIPTPSSSTTTRHHSSAPTLPPGHPPDDDSLLKELHFPFATPHSHVNDLAKFYRDCYNAPPLSGLTEMQNVEAIGGGGGGGCSAVANTTTGTVNGGTSIDDLSRQLEQFETSLEQYDKLVSQLGLSNSSSTGSRSSGGLQMSN